VRITLALARDAKQNADFYYSEGKRYREKAEKAKAALGDVEKRIAGMEKEGAKRKVKKAVLLKTIQKREWFWQFRHFYTGGGRLCIAGRNADENEEIVKKHMEDKDLFFHADIHGGAVAILKDGTNADIRERLECAVFAASYSSAWELGYNEVDVFAARKEQITKTVSEGNLKKGGFGIEGEREWYKHTVLGLLIGKLNGAVSCSPWNLNPGFRKCAEIRPGGNMQKQQAVKRIMEMFSCAEEEASSLVPKGKITLRVKK
jgi:predicted ribosome quality control (RQC) complex YloA/Tae2 family protein